MAEALITAEFTFNVEAWEPMLDWMEAGHAIDLQISQPALETLNTPDGAENK